MSASAQRANARQRPEKGLRNSPNALNFDEIALRVSLDELLNLNYRCGGGYADLPKGVGAVDHLCLCGCEVGLDDASAFSLPVRTSTLLIS